VTPAPRPTLAADQVRATARAFGFDPIGIARVVALPEAPHFRRWLADGRHAGMGWLADRVEERLDPARLDPHWRSVVSVAESYWRPVAAGAMPAGSADVTPDGSGDVAVAKAAAAPTVTAKLSAPPAVPRGRIARYAWGADYHNVLGKRLRRFAAELRRMAPGLATRLSVDTGPMMDRAWAVAGGLGWWGKHTNVVSRSDGSWLLLGTLLVDVDLEPDAPHADFCGTCRACIDVCPTRAIVAERVLDARLCISYWTIEHRGSIPEELRPAIGDWIFGCDLCLDVCPWNRFATASREARFDARADNAAPALLPLLELDAAAFRERFHGSAVQRAGRDGFVRNVCVALGNVAGAEALEPLARTAAADPSDVVREHARWATARIEARLGAGNG
jgi:epoxyqueuosine reductase